MATKEVVNMRNLLQAKSCDAILDCAIARRVTQVDTVFWVGKMKVHMKQKRGQLAIFTNSLTMAKTDSRSRDSRKLSMACDENV